MVVDEISYLNLNQSGAVRFFQLMSRPYEHASIALTSNKGFEDWGEILGDELMAAALIDRTVHHCHLVNIRGNSYRMREHTEIWKALREDDSEGTAGIRRKRRAPREAKAS